MKPTSPAAALCATACLLIHARSTAAVVTFEDIALAPSGYWNGSDGSGGFTSGGATFHNNYDDTYSSWSGFAVSNHTNTTTQGWSNQYSAFTGGGAGGSAQYVIGYYSTYDPVSTHVNFSVLTNLSGKGASFTNTTWAALEMANGGAFGAKKFGGATGNDADWFLLTIEGFDGAVSTGSVDVHLADFRDSDNSNDYILDEWRYVDFSPLGSVTRIEFSLSSSDNGTFGMNTPSYFAMDNFLAVPEPSTAITALSGLALLIRRKR